MSFQIHKHTKMSATTKNIGRCVEITQILIVIRKIRYKAMKRVKHSKSNTVINVGPKGGKFELVKNKEGSLVKQYIRKQTKKVEEVPRIKQTNSKLTIQDTFRA